MDALLAIEGAVASTSDGGAFARPTVDLPAAAWREAHQIARDSLDFNFFDWLSAVDEIEEGFTVVTHLWSTAGKRGVLLRTRIARDPAAVASVVPVYPGAAWHERETHEMFGVVFLDFPGELKPLLLAPEFEGHPLRKEFVLASRVAKDWPGAREPGESAAEGAAKRQKMRPPGVPDPNEWGPRAGQLGAAADDSDPRAARRAAAGDRPARNPRAAGSAPRSRASAEPGESSASGASVEVSDPDPRSATADPGAPAAPPSSASEGGGASGGTSTEADGSA